MRTPHRYGLHYNASDDTHWGSAQISSPDDRTVLSGYFKNPEQLPNVQVLMSVDGFKACYLVNCEESTHSTILGNRAYVTGAQLVLLSASLHIGAFEQLTVSLEHADILVRYAPNLPGYACVLIVDKQQTNAASPMYALKAFCDGLV